MDTTQITPDREIVFSIFNDATDNQPKPHVLQWEQMADWLCTHIHTDVTDKKTLPAWSPAVYQEGSPRRNEFVKLITCLCYDVDHEVVGREEVAMKLQAMNINYAISSSFSSTKDDPHWRLILPLSNPITPQEFKHVYHSIGSELFTDEGYDHSTDDPARLWFQPYTPHVRQSFSDHYTAGAFYDLGSEYTDDIIDDTDTSDDAINLAWYLAPSKVIPDIEIERMLQFTHPDDGHNTWQMVIFALQHNYQHDPDTGLHLAHSWSLESLHYNPAEIDSMWSRSPSTTNPITIGSLINHVKKKGYIPPEYEDYGVYPFKPIGSLLDIDPPPVAWLVHQLVVENKLSMLAGDGNTGKSMLLMQLAIATAAGLPFFNKPTAQRPVIFINAEDDTDEFRRRAINYISLLDLSETERNAIRRNLRYFGAESHVKRLNTKDNIRDLANSINAVCKGLAPLILMDPFISYAHGDENDNTAMGQTIEAYRALERLTGGTFLFAHHLGKTRHADGRPGTSHRGASSIRDGIRQGYLLRYMTPDELQRFMVHVPEDSHELRGWVVLEHDKASGGGLSEPIYMRRTMGGALIEAEEIDDAERAESLLGEEVIAADERLARIEFWKRVWEHLTPSMPMRHLMRSADMRNELAGDLTEIRGEGMRLLMTRWVERGIELGVFDRPHGRAPLERGRLDPNEMF